MAQQQLQDGAPHRARQPHDNWARYYDFVCQQSFGNAYTILCDDTEEICRQLIAQSPMENGIAYILDIGAGTGRIAIPLLRQGHHVTAVEPSEFMCDEIRTKLDEPLHNNLIIEQDLIQNVALPSQFFDIALLLFS